MADQLSWVQCVNEVASNGGISAGFNSGSQVSIFGTAGSTMASGVYTFPGNFFLNPGQRFRIKWDGAVAAISGTSVTIFTVWNSTSVNMNGWTGINTGGNPYFARIEIFGIWQATGTATNSLLQWTARYQLMNGTASTSTAAATLYTNSSTAIDTTTAEKLDFQIQFSSTSIHNTFISTAYTLEVLV
jgi:hypothetical protein